MFPKASDPPTVPENVVSPDPATIVKVLVSLTLLTVPENVISLSVVVKVMLPLIVAFSP